MNMDMLNCNFLSGEVLMYGDKSLGAFMEKYDVTSFPSPRQPAPGELIDP